MSSIASDLEDIGKLFVGGLSAATTKESLHNYFSQFGEVVDSVVMKNAETGKSRGFGFITFKDPSCVHNALQVKYHDLDGKRIDPKQCTPRSMQKLRKQAGKCKVFMGGLPPDITEEVIRSGMSRFGKVDQVVIMIDQDTKKCRGFGFLSFELEESTEQVCAQRYVIINGKQIECKKAEPRVNPKRLTQAFGLTKDQNGFVGSSAYGQISSVPQSNWTIPMNQPLYNFQGNSLANYQSYGNSALVAYNASSPTYPSVQTMPFVQSYASNYGTPVTGYNYSPISTHGYSQNTFATNSQSSNIGGLNTTITTENEKPFAIDATYATQSTVSIPNFQRFHPYKV